MKPLNLPRQYKTMARDIDAAITRVLNSGRFIGGPAVEAFEQRWAAYLGVSHCVGVGSGSDALTIALQAADITGQVIVPANTAYPTAEAVVRAGATPVFCDCGPKTYTLDIAHAQRLVGHHTQAIIPVHLYGHPANMEVVQLLAHKHGLFVLEDCAHAHGAEYQGIKVGNFGHAAAWSFNPTKILGASGDAGAITTHDADLAERCRKLADHGRADKHTHELVGHNSRLDAIQAAVLGAKLKYLDDWVTRRRFLAQIYRERLADKVEVPTEAAWARHSYHQFVVRSSSFERDRIRAALWAVYEIETGVHYPLPLNEQPALVRYNGTDTPIARDYARRILSLPINESMYIHEAHAVCDALLEVLE